MLEGDVDMSSAKRKTKRPRCLLIAGPNGSGKTTFAAAVAAARWVLREIDRLVANQLDFAFERHP